MFSCSTKPIYKRPFYSLAVSIEQQHHQARSPAMIFPRNFDQLSLKDGILVGVGRSSTMIRLGLLHQVPQRQAPLAEAVHHLDNYFLLIRKKNLFINCHNYRIYPQLVILQAEAKKHSKAVINFMFAIYKSALSDVDNG
ncbi:MULTISPECIES: hypothetical protein [unclassified Microcoleus]|uniref:hypothetical protein n=1 Tax=unclassified Microcoleus TaxID=2642155 RepID=UPI002FD15E51